MGGAVNGPSGRTRGHQADVSVVAVEMGYGHLRPAHSLAAAMGVPVLSFDAPPLATEGEHRFWRRVRSAYEIVSRASQAPGVGRIMGGLLDGVTHIQHLHPYRDLSAPSGATLLLHQLARRGFGARLMDHVRQSRTALLTTFYAPAVVADLAGWDRIVCVVTDTDVNRVWVPRDGARSRIHYCVPAERTVRRLQAYGVAADRIHLTGFPLPQDLVGGPDLGRLRDLLACRLVRLDPSGRFRGQFRDELERFVGPLPTGQAGCPPLLVFAIGGAGAQLAVVRTVLPALKDLLLRGRLRLCLVAGTRPAVNRVFQRWLDQNGLLHLHGDGIEILWDRSVPSYLARFNSLLEEADVLWTKPSELTFYGALGIPLILSRPVGVHERSNRQWALHRGVAFKQEHPGFAGLWLQEWLQDGTLAAAAWSGALRIPKRGTDAVMEVVGRLPHAGPNPSS